jgi:Cu/Ag efflux pump CusA
VAVVTGLPADVAVNTSLFQLKSFLDRGISYVEEARVIGAVLVVIVLFLFLLNVRTTLITLTAIPLSLVVTTLVFRLIGTLSGRELSINVMTLGGIAVAMGKLVDDAIVDVENIYRRLGERRTRTTCSCPSTMRTTTVASAGPSSASTNRRWRRPRSGWPISSDGSSRNCGGCCNGGTVSIAGAQIDRLPG